MATTIKLKNGSGAPLAGDLVQGEPALDLTNKRLYTEDSGGTVIEIGTSPSTIDINAGTIDGTVIGGSSAAAGTFTTFTSTGIDDNATSTAITIDSSQNVGIGTASPSTSLDVVRAGAQPLRVESTSGTECQINLVNTGGNVQLEAHSGNFTIEADNVGIGTTSPSTDLDVRNNISMGDGTSVTQLSMTRNNANYIAATDASGYLVFRTGGNNERLRIDSSGNLLVGKTSNDNTTNGFVLDANGTLNVVRSSEYLMRLNRTTTDGEILRFQKDGTTVGSIQSQAGTRLIVSSESVAGYLAVGGTRYYAWNSIYFGGVADNAYDLGHPSVRFDDVYATNGTIQTSDANEKQDIEALSDAETRVAVAAKALLRKFRWKSAVEEKGDEARVHFGIIAQDLKSAFEAEGLDAGRYAMFINSTWTDEETGEERSRMGVRYSELLAFIIAAI